MKILVLGDSHTAAVKYGWDAIAGDHRGKRLEFFALPKRRMNRLKAQGGRLMMAERAVDGDKRRFEAAFGAESVEAGAYDAILLVGLLETGHTLIAANARTLLPDQAAPAPRGGGLLRLARRRSAPAPAPVARGTRAMFAAAFDCVFEASVARSVLRQMAKLGGPPCHWARNPLISAAVLTSDHALRPAFEAALARGDAARMLEIAEDRARAQLPGHVALIAQPARTIHRGCMTETGYMSGARTFYDRGQTFGRNDILHANGAYGALLLEAVFAAQGAREGVA